MTRYTLLLFVLVFLALDASVAVVDARAQGPEWMMRIPKYYRLKGGSSQFVVDPVRKATLFDGGAYDTYVTYDGGGSWESIFDIKMFFIDVQSNWKIDGAGNWYYQGLVYAHFNVNLVTEDAGKTIRYLVQDTNQLPLNGRYELPLNLVMPNSVYFDPISIETDTSKRGIYSSCDAGRTWQFAKQPSMYYTGNSMKGVHANHLSFHLENHKYIERDLCNATWDSTTVPIVDWYVRFNDSTVLTYNQRPLRIRRGVLDTNEVYRYYINPDNGALRKLVSEAVTLLNDTTALIIAKEGVVATYSPGVGLRFVDVPPYRHPQQRVCDVGRFGDLLLVRTVIPNGAGVDSNNRWTVLNIVTGSVSQYIRPGAPITRELSPWPLLQNQRVVPYSDSVWIATLDFGEVMRTTDAGVSWKMIENMPRDEQWGLNFVGATRLYPRGDGAMAVLSERGRLLVNEPGTKSWTITHLGPFSHAFKFSPTSTFYLEDYRGKLRSRFGPSTAYFHHPDTLWTSGDVVTRWSSSGVFIDTVLTRKARLIKRLSDKLIVAAMDSVWLSFNDGREWVYINEHWPKVVYGKDTVKCSLGDMVVTPSGSILAGLRGIRLYDTLGIAKDSVPGGIIRSTDNGLTWSPGPTGVPNYLYISSLIKLPTGTLLCLASEITVDPRTFNASNEPSRMALSDCGVKQHKFGQAYIYRSVDDGWTWTETFIFPSREFLPATDPTFTMMPDGRIMAINPDAGIAVSATDGASFGIGDPLYIGNPVINDVVFTNDGWAHFATDSGYVRVRISNILDVKEETRNIGSLRAHVSAADVLSITCDIVPTSLRLIALDGTTVRSTVEPLTHSLALDVSALAAGTYVVVASNANEVRSALIQLP